MKMIFIKQISERVDATPRTVLNWIKKGIFPNAVFTPAQPPYPATWMVPESDLKNFVKPKVGKPAKHKKEKTA